MAMATPFLNILYFPLIDLCYLLLLTMKNGYMISNIKINKIC